MKKILVIAVAMATMTVSTYAQANDRMLFNHMALGISAGVNGVGADIAVPMSRYAQLRVGASVMPAFTYTQSMDVNVVNPTGWDNYMHDYPEANISKMVDINARAFENKYTLTTKALVSIYPFGSNRVPLAITGGMLVGVENVASTYSDGLKPYAELQKLGIVDGLDIGGTTGRVLPINDEGHAEITCKVKRIKPYVGLTLGRAVPQKKRVACCMDLGVAFWGNPEVRDTEGNLLSSEDFDEDAGKLVSMMSKLNVCPMLSIRISGRLF